MRMNGIPEDMYTIKDVPLDNTNDSQNYIHEIRVKGKSEGLPTLVLIHGYLSGGL